MQEKRSCKNFCPIYESIYNHNINREYKISCFT